MNCLQCECYMKLNLSECLFGVGVGVGVIEKKEAFQTMNCATVNFAFRSEKAAEIRETQYEVKPNPQIDESDKAFDLICQSQRPSPQERIFRKSLSAPCPINTRIGNLDISKNDR